MASRVPSCLPVIIPRESLAVYSLLVGVACKGGGLALDCLPLMLGRVSPLVGVACKSDGVALALDAWRCLPSVLG